MVLPNYKQCEVILLKGEKRQLWQDEAAETIEDLARSEGCKKIAVHARPGWKGFLGTKEWKVKRYLYTKELK
jgi:tRNA-dihydrouridine synthase